MSNTLDATEFSSTVGIGSSAYYTQIRVGSGTPGNATGADDLYVEGDLEVDGSIYIDGSSVEFTHSSPAVSIDANRATALVIDDGSSAMMTFDTTTGSRSVELNTKLVLDNDKGITTDDDSAHPWPQWYSFTLADGDAAGAILNQQNPTDVAAIVLRLLVRITTVATGACTADFGVAATGTSSDTLIDGLDVNAATGNFSNISDPGTNGSAAGTDIGATQYITGSMATGAAAGLAGTAYVEIVPQS